jgi:hypothetical protein
MKTKHNLAHGELTIIARETGVSTTTANLALSGKINTLTAKIICEYTEIFRRQREERLKILEKLRAQ